MSILETIRYQTLEDFSKRVPGFVIAEVIKDGPICVDGEYTYEADMCDELGMTSTEFNHTFMKYKSLRPSRRKFADHYRKYNGEPLHNRSLFVWRGGGLGDLLFIRPILCHLKKLYPSCIIRFATRERFKPLMYLFDDCIDELANVPFQMSTTMDASDYHLSFQGVIEDCKDSETTDVHDMFARHAGLDPDEIDWIVPMRFEALIPPFKYAVVQCMASSPIRTPRIGDFVHVVNEITKRGYRVFLSDGEHNTSYLDDVLSCCDDPELVMNFARKNRSIIDSVNLISNASLVVAPDSSHTHIAAMQGIPCLSFYGPFPARVRCLRYPKAEWVHPEKSDVCKYGGVACFKHGYERCESHCACWNNIDRDKLTSKVHQMLDEVGMVWTKK